MKQLLLAAYIFFQNRKTLFYSLTAFLFALLAFLASQIIIEEDINRLLPESGQTKQITGIFKSANFADKVIVKITARGETQPETLIALADSFETNLLQKHSAEIASLKKTVSDETALDIYNTVHNHLPIYLEQEDYNTIDSLIAPERVAQTMNENYSAVTSATGMILKKLIADDPVGISNIALRRLQQLQLDENYTLYDGYIMSNDLRSLFMFITLQSLSGETGKNIKLFAGFDQIITSLNPQKSSAEIFYYGNPVVAAGNAKQLRRDSLVTLSITVVLILLFVGFFFRKKSVPLIMMLPVLFGGVFALAVIALTRGSISSIAIGAGSVVLGIAVNYSLHFFSHYRHCGSVQQTISDLLSPMTIGSVTTVGSFLSLSFMQSQILNDFGLFAGLSLVGATFFALVFLPHFIPANLHALQNRHVQSQIEKLLNFKIKQKGILFPLIILLTGFLFYHARNVSFQTDLNSVNFMSEQTKNAQNEIDITQNDTSKLVFIAVNGNTEEEMLQNNEILLRQLHEAKSKGWVEKYSSFSRFIPSQKQQQEKIKRWNDFWTKQKKETLLAAVKREAAKAGFSPTAFQSFETLLAKEYVPVTGEYFAPVRQTFGSEYLIASENRQTVINAVQVNKTQRKLLYAELNKHPFTVVLDKQIITNKFVEIIVSDFNSILLLTSGLVFFALLISYGRLELTIITFLPMAISWIWILGIMSLIGLQFNLINIIISTFIFGLGDDFSIFITDGLTRKFKEGKETLVSHRVSIFLCAVTVLIGLGALLFAKHPALRSVALVSVIGIFCVVVIGQTLQPLLYNFFIQSRKEKGLPPWTIPTLLLFWIAFGYFVTVCLLATLVGYILIYLVPFPGKKKRKLFFHFLVCHALRVLTYMMVNVRKTHIGKENMDFSKPAIIIANHASFLDILVTVMQHPKLILLTNHWVYYSPVFGKVVQLADYYPVMQGAGAAIDKFADIVNDGYSIVVFPEGTRSPDGNLKRFHKGAFYLAEQLNVDIVPVLLHGTGDTIRKGDFMVMNSHMTMKFLPRIKAGDKSFGDGYAERTKNISWYFKAEFEKLKEEKETPRYFRQRLRMSYIYKGPELEWLAVKESRREKFYSALDKALPEKGMITELGCGYGFIAYMLSFTGWRRNITGIDASEEKIDVANNCFSKNSTVNFVCADVMNYPLTKSDGFIINRKNLRLSEVELSGLIKRCKDKLNENGVLVIIDGKVPTAYSFEKACESVFVMK